MPLKIRGMLAGAIGMASFVAGLYFFKFWKKTNDRFFLFFAIAFWIDALNRVIFGLVDLPENYPALFLLRVGAFGLILFAIIDKNLRKTQAR